MFKNLVIVTLLAVIAVGGALAVRAQNAQSTVSVGIAVWEEKATGNLYASFRPDGGTWKTQALDDPLDMRFTESSSGRFWRSNIVWITAPVSIDWEAIQNAWRIGNPPWRWEATCTSPAGRTGGGGGYDTPEEARAAGQAWVAGNCISTTSGPDPLEPSEVIVIPSSR